MARQNMTPVTFNRTTRTDAAVLMTSGRAGVVLPMGFIPLLRGDSCAGRVGLDVNLAHMPKPLLNGVTLNVQAWFVPKAAHPQFVGTDEMNYAYTGEKIRALGAADRDPPPFFFTDAAAFANSAFAKTLGLHVPGSTVHTDLVDAFNLIWNFRAAAHSSKLPRRQYMAENATSALAFPPAFWPSNRITRVVPDYERALIVGQLDLDILAGRIPVKGLFFSPTPPTGADFGAVNGSTPSSIPAANARMLAKNGGVANEPFAELADALDVAMSLADIDKARTTQAFAKLRTAYAGNDTTGFNDDDAILALLMQGLSVPEDQFKRPILLDAKRVMFGMQERFATDGASLDQSVSQGFASVVLSLNVPRQDVGGVIVFTAEVLPERIFERMSDEWLLVTDVDQFPNALRDVQRTEPVDLVPNRRVDARHAQPAGLYGYEPMNDKWNREFTRLGGDFYQADPSNPYKEARAAIWQPNIVNPTYSADHFLAPQPFPHDVFSDPMASAFECVVRHQVRIVGLTQFGDILAEDNNDYAAIEGGGIATPAP